MPEYLVTWQIDVFDATDPEAAARHALKIQRDKYSIATCFRVQCAADGTDVEVDLDECEAFCTVCGATHTAPPCQAPETVTEEA